MSLADEENVQPLLSEQDVETGEPVGEEARVTEESGAPEQGNEPTRDPHGVQYEPADDPADNPRPLEEPDRERRPDEEPEVVDPEPETPDEDDEEA